MDERVRARCEDRDEQHSSKGNGTSNWRIDDLSFSLLPLWLSILLYSVRNIREMKKKRDDGTINKRHASSFTTKYVRTRCPYKTWRLHFSLWFFIFRRNYKSLLFFSVVWNFEAFNLIDFRGWKWYWKCGIIWFFSWLYAGSSVDAVKSFNQLNIIHRFCRYVWSGQNKSDAHHLARYKDTTETYSKPAERTD